MHEVAISAGQEAQFANTIALYNQEQGQMGPKTISWNHIYI